MSNSMASDFVWAVDAGKIVSMYYIVPLGNPGDKYKRTRHNVGWQAIDFCMAAWGLASLVESGGLSGRLSEGVVEGNKVTVLYPTTFMNNSGSAVVKLVPKVAVEQLIVVHDDIDLPLGEIKVAQGKGAGGNNGVSSIIEKLGSKDFVRVRIGIAPKSFWTGKTKRPAGGGPLERFVLKDFTSSERTQLEDVFPRVQQVIETIVAEGVMKAMNQFN